jgi:hypothetical protein
VIPPTKRQQRSREVGPIAHTSHLPSSQQRKVLFGRFLVPNEGADRRSRLYPSLVIASPSTYYIALPCLTHLFAFHGVGTANLAQNVASRVIIRSDCPPPPFALRPLAKLVALPPPSTVPCSPGAVQTRALARAHTHAHTFSFASPRRGLI